MASKGGRSRLDLTDGQRAGRRGDRQVSVTPGHAQTLVSRFEQQGIPLLLAGGLGGLFPWLFLVHP